MATIWEGNGLHEKSPVEEQIEQELERIRQRRDELRIRMASFKDVMEAGGKVVEAWEQCGDGTGSAYTKLHQALDFFVLLYRADRSE